MDDCVGVGELSDLENAVNLFPNPSMGSFTLESENKIDRIEIIDQSGKMVMMRKIEGNKTLISALRSKGMYFVRIYLEGQDEIPQVVTKGFVIR